MLRNNRGFDTIRVTPKSHAMQTTEFRRPARFRINDTDAFLVRHPDGATWVAVPAGFGGDESVMVFEHGDPEVENGAASQGYAGRWIDEADAQVIEERQQRMTAAKPGEYPWDDWQRDALAAGLDPELATLGRAVMREADQHGWCDSLKYECGIHDDPAMFAGMIQSAKEQPEWQKARWTWLLETDGLRFDPWEREEYSPYSEEWNGLYHRWAKENLPAVDPKSEAAMLREAYEYIREIHQLDQLAIIDLEDQTFSMSASKTIFYAKYYITSTEKRGQWLPHLSHRGLVQVIAKDGSNELETGAFREVQEGDE